MDANTFGAMLALTVKLAQQGKTSHGDLQATCAATHSANGCRAFLQGAKAMREPRRPAAVLSFCGKLGEDISVHQFAHGVHAKVIVVFRDPADLLWANYNSLTFDVDRRRHPEFGGVARLDNYRSPEFFQELLLGGDRIVGGMQMTPSWLYSHLQVPSFYRIRESFGARNSLFLRMEDFEEDSDFMLSRLANFTGQSLSGFNKKLLRQSGSSGVPQLASHEEGLHGSFQISGRRPMFCKSRAIIYNASRGLCEELFAQFGLSFPHCLEGSAALGCKEPGEHLPSAWHEAVQSRGGGGVAVAIVLLLVVASCLVALAAGALLYKKCHKGDDDDDGPRRIVLDMKGGTPMGRGRLEEEEWGLGARAGEKPGSRAKWSGWDANAQKVAENSPGEEEEGAPLVQG